MSATPVPADAGDREPIPSLSSVSSGGGGAAVGLRWINKIVPYIPALVPAAIVVGIVYTLVDVSGLHNFGSSFWGAVWDPQSNTFGVAVFVVGSFLTAVPALFFAMIIGLGIAVASTTYLPGWLTRILDPFVDLLAGIPSIVYGIWAVVIVAPLFGTDVNPWIANHFAIIPGFAGNAISPSSEGFGLPISIFILTLMALPITTLLIRDALRSIPRDLWESGLALGATRWEVTRKVAIPYGQRGIWSAAFLGFGRAFGETVAVAMVIGAATKYPTNVYDTTYTMASFMFENLDAAFGQPNSAIWLSALAEIALLLLGITLVVNILGRRLIAALQTVEVPGL